MNKLERVEHKLPYDICRFYDQIESISESMRDKKTFLNLLSNEYAREIVEDIYKEMKETNMRKEKKMITLMEIPFGS
jgi:hypothetical protein